MGTKDNVINSFLAKRERFADILNQGSINICEALEAIREEGKESGKEIGKELGENLFAELTGRLLEKNSTDDLLKAAKDKGYRKLLYKEYGLN